MTRSEQVKPIMRRGKGKSKTVIIIARELAGVEGLYDFGRKHRQVFSETDLRKMIADFQERGAREVVILKSSQPAL